MNERGWVVLALCSALGLGLVGCGDDDGGGGGNGAIQIGGCPTFSGCGGEIEGTWSYDGACIDDEMPFDTSFCPSIRLVDTNGEVSGTLTVADGLLTQSTTASFSATFDLPGECTMGLACSMIESALDGADGIDGSACSEAGDGCRCTITTANTSMSSDMVTISGNIATTGSGERYEYCVSGGTLRYRNLDDADFAGVFTLVR
ncbi:MAG: hypothetical protein IT379_09510 [Deltaproteobacteria bacterium]|nr:hypothetical protein [Deltaproteobacteria bacterium]